MIHLCVGHTELLTLLIKKKIPICVLDLFLGPPTNWLTFTKSVINQSLMDQFISNKVYCNGNNEYYNYNKKYIYDIIFTNRNILGVAMGGCLAEPEYSRRCRTRIKLLEQQKGA